MRKIPVVSGRHEKHAHVIKRQADHEIRPVKFQKESRKARGMHDKKRNRAHQRNSIAILESHHTKSHGTTSLRTHVLKESCRSAGTRSGGRRALNRTCRTTSIRGGEGSVKG